LWTRKTNTSGFPAKESAPRGKKNDSLGEDQGEILESKVFKESLGERGQER